MSGNRYELDIEDRILMEEALAFVKHIQRHLHELEIDGKVVCKICGKTIDEIYEEETGE